MSCRYDVACQSGEQTLSFSCGDAGWALDPGDCSHAYDSCSAADAECMGGRWVPRFEDPGTSNPPAPCPAEKPSPGASCAEDSNPFGTPTCGYFCPNGKDWTVGACFFPDEPVWAFDGACEGDCSNSSLLEYVQNRKYCSTADECQAVQTSGCSTIVDHCSGTLYVNMGADPAEILRLDEALSQCQQTGGCATCSDAPPAAACIDGQCAPQVTD